MKLVTHFVRRNIARIVAIVFLVLLYLMAQLPGLSKAERNQLATNFHFGRTPLYEVPASTYRSHRIVNPSLQRIASWVSATGASVALNDLDGDGVSNDVCHVDPRTDRVTVAPAPGTAMRYQPFVLDAGRLYDANVMAPMGCLPGDLNEDGLMDLVVTYWGRTPIAFLARKQQEKASLANDNYKAREVVAGGDRWFTGAATLADLDGDGHLDLVIGNYYQDGARILDAHDNTRQVMQHSMSRAYNAGRSRLLLWQNATEGSEPSVQFKTVEDYVEGSPAQKEMFTHGWTLAVGAADLDGDLLPEIYFANDFGPDRFLHNRSRPGELRFAVLEGHKSLTTPSSKVLGRDSFKGMGVDFADLNGDRIFDIFVSNIATPFALEESHFVFLSTGAGASQQFKNGAAPYVDKSEDLGLSRSGWGWEIKTADLNNDGAFEVLQATGFLKGKENRWPELQELATANDQLLSNPNTWPRFQPGDALSDRDHNPFYVRAGDGRFYDLAAELGLDQEQVSRGIAVADVNGDGLLDYAVANQWATSFFYLNESPKHGAFLGLRLRLPLDQKSVEPTKICSNGQGLNLPGRNAIGAVVTVKLPDGRQLITQVDGGNGHSGKRSPDVHFGLGSLSPAVRLPVEINWRTAQGQVQRQTIQLSPGWHTVMLGQPERMSNDCQSME